VSFAGFLGSGEVLGSFESVEVPFLLLLLLLLSRFVKAATSMSNSRRTPTQAVPPSYCSFFRHGHWPFQVKHTLFPPLLLLLLHLQIRQGNNPNFQFKTHPNIDKAGYSNGVLGLKDPSRPFPTGGTSFLFQTAKCCGFIGIVVPHS
jgi:hypothetical protein